MDCLIREPGIPGLVVTCGEGVPEAVDRCSRYLVLGVLLTEPQPAQIPV